MMLVRSFIRGLHDDQRGSLSIVSVFALILLVILLGLVMNSSLQVDQKVKMQNAADAASYSGGIVIVRGMNTLAFTNHLLSDVFALTAFMREAKERNAESLTPEILANWHRVAPAFIGSEFPRFDQLGLAIQEKVPDLDGPERDMVLTFSEWSFAAQEIMLPVLEEILEERMIPEFQRSLTEATPRLSQYAADEIAQRHGRAWPRRATLRGVMWRTFAEPVGGPTESVWRTLPVVDPVMDNDPDQVAYLEAAREQRQDYAHRYLSYWNAESLEPFDRYGKMSQFANLWRIFTCGQLERLLEQEYPYDNLPFQVRLFPSETGFDGDPGPVWKYQDELLRDYTFVGVVYRERISDKIPGIFRNPAGQHTQAFAQIMTFVPRNRLQKVILGTSDADPSGNGDGTTIGGIPGQEIEIEVPSLSWQPSQIGDEDDDEDGDAGNGEEPLWYVRRQRHSQRWHLFNQNWTVQMVPATAREIPSILSLDPDPVGAPMNLVDLSGLSDEDFQWLNHH